MKKPIFETTVAMPDSEVSGKSIQVRITVAADGIVLHPEGTGVQEDSSSGPVLLELYKGKLQLQVWTDINSPDPKTINLEGSRESLRD